ncbi:Concanavalin A-like lectin/glucanase, subgroup [Cynara cardunculus var. scolymus]|uniref:Concanavalin A-like lectin/glucanase, subgroup n=1 Tax=Cynara cardunculus var. scolymus TaxID=59895 RepID=A0A124SEW0_CYNCS|nr:Concanavalin A-like lectin/glucanase, subgroup [Cynara cardunculus var. scolymus]
MIPAATLIADEHKLYSLAAERSCRRFSLAEIQSATLNFDDQLVIGKGGFGKVYKAYLHGNTGTPALVAIKRLDSFSSQGPNEFMTEIEMLSKFRHCNLVSLIGYCSDGDEKILVYEYMPNGTIEHHLHKARTPLSWMDRLKISIGAARGLDYLHTGVDTQHGVIHRDVKSSNILLDENWAAKISDFGLSKIGPTDQPSSCVSTLVKGTFGYLDPEYSMTGHLTRKSDVYAFGVVLFELLSGRRAVDRSFDEDEWGLVKWAQQRVKERRLDQIVCSQISGQISPKCLKEFAQIADRCLRSSRRDRPTMAEVVVALQLSMVLQQQFITSTQLAGAMGFTNIMQKYLVFRTSRDNEHSVDFEQSMSQEVRIYSYSEMEVATRNFSSEMLLGSGDFGEVFRGWLDKKTYKPSKLDSGLAVAVRRLFSNKFEPHKLKMKVLEEFKDANVVKVLGYCIEGDSAQLADCSLQMHNILLDKLLTGKMIDDSGDLIGTTHRLPGEYGFVSMQSIYSSLDDRLRLNFLMRRPAFQLALLAQKCVVEELWLRPTLESALEEVEEIYAIMLKSENSTGN